MRLVALALALLPLWLAPFSLAADPAPVELDLTDCDYLESINTVPGALVDPLIPDGDFTVAASANLVVGLATCTATTSEGETDTVTFGWADVSVYPRPGLRSPEGGLHLYRIEHIAMDDLYGRAHAQWGTECRVVTDASVVASLLDTHATASDAGGLVWDIRVPVGVPPDGTGGSTHYREFGPANGGYAYLEGDLVSPGAASIPGTFLVDPESRLFTLWGPAWPSRVFQGPGFGILDTTISFLPDATSPTPSETC